MTVALLFAAILIGYVRKGRLSNLANLKIRLIPLMVLAFLLQGAIYAGYAYGIEQIQDFDILLHFVSYILLFAALMSNFDNKWFIVITLGVIMNFVVIFLNGGKMPVSLSAAETIGITDSLEAMFASRAGTHQPLIEGTLVWYLADILPLPLPGALSMFSNIYSVGDIFIYGGAMGLIQSAMKKDKSIESELDLEDLDEEMFDRPVPEEEFLNGYFDDQSDIRSKKIQEKLEKIESDAMEQTMVLGSVEKPQKVEIPDMEESHFESDEKSDEDTEKTKSEPIESEEKIIEEKTSADEKLDDVTLEDYKASEMLNASKLEDEVLYNQLQQEPESKYYTKPLHETRTIDLEPFTSLNDKEDQKAAEEKDIEEDKALSETLEASQQIPSEPIDTVHQFIIVDGRIVENPHYNKKPAELKPELQEDMHQQADEDLPEEAGIDIDQEAEQRTFENQDMDEKAVEIQEVNETSFEFSGLDKKIIEEQAVESTEVEQLRDESGNVLQRLTDSERVDLMKKMKERKEKGYSLVQVKVGDKHISFWKKDL